MPLLGSDGERTLRPAPIPPWRLLPRPTWMVAAMTDAELALEVLRAMAVDPTDWTIEDDTACIEATWFNITPEQADLLRRLRPNG